MTRASLLGLLRALQFAGISLDTALMEARLPEDKLAKFRTQLDDFCSRKSVTLKELQSVIGLLYFACCVLVPGRVFLHCLIDLTSGIRRPTHRYLAGRFERVQWQILFPQFAMGHFPKPQFIYERGGLLGLSRNVWETLVFWKVARRLETIQH